MNLFPFYLYVLAIIGLIAQMSLTYVARRKGREAPWSLSPSYEPPRFADSRLNKIEAFLLVVAMPLGIVLAVVGVLLGVSTDSLTAGSAVIVLAMVCLLARAVFLTGCLAFAELEDKSHELGSS